MMKIGRHFSTVIAAVGTVALEASGASADPVVQSGQKLAFLGASVSVFGWSHPTVYVRRVVDALKQNGADIVPTLSGEAETMPSLRTTAGFCTAAYCVAPAAAPHPHYPQLYVAHTSEKTSMFPGTTSDFHGYTCHSFLVDGCAAKVVEPKTPLPGHPWVWRTMFWDAFPKADIALLDRGFTLAFIDVGNTFGCPDAMKHFDTFYTEMTKTYGLYPKPAMEGLSRGGLYAYRWAYVNTDKVGRIYGDAPVCDMKSWPGGKGKGPGSPQDWQEAIKDYHFTSEAQMMAFNGNPIDILAPIAAAHIPIIHVYGDSDTALPHSENTDILRDRYRKLGGDFALIVKEGCDHHPHGLNDPTPVVDFIVAHASAGPASVEAAKTAPKPGSVLVLPQGKW